MGHSRPDAHERRIPAHRHRQTRRGAVSRRDGRPRRDNALELTSRSLPFYFVTIFITFLPWSLKLPWLAKKRWRERDPLDNYLISGIALVFVIFTLVKTKLPHYTLPAYPLLALLLAKALAEAQAQRSFRATGRDWLRRCSACSSHARHRSSRAIRPRCSSCGWRAPISGPRWSSAQSITRSRASSGTRASTSTASCPISTTIRCRRSWRKPARALWSLPTKMAAAHLPDSAGRRGRRYRAEGINTANFKRMDLTLILKPS